MSKTKAVAKKQPKNELVLTEKDQGIISNIVLKGDISGLSPDEKVKYYNLFCQSLGLNPVTQPFQIISFRGGKETLYATKDCTEQLRKLNGVSVTDSESQIMNDTLIVKVKGCDKTGRTDCATGAVCIKNLQGDALANAIMKTETKAKRRLTLSICGLGILDESEIHTIPGAVQKTLNGKAVNEAEIIKTDKPEVNKELVELNQQLNAKVKRLAWNDVKLDEYIKHTFGAIMTKRKLDFEQKKKLSVMLDQEIDKMIQDKDSKVWDELNNENNQEKAQ